MDKMVTLGLFKLVLDSDKQVKILFAYNKEFL